MGERERRIMRNDDAPSPFFLSCGSYGGSDCPFRVHFLIDFPIEHSETLAFFLFLPTFYQIVWRGKEEKKSTYKVDPDQLYVSAWEGIARGEMAEPVLT